jgi:prolyl oligopeptidase
MAARMIEMGHPVYYYENVEGGHAAATNNEQRAYMSALSYAYLWQQLGASGTGSVKAPSGG